jgi:hypothetical protein
MMEQQSCFPHLLPKTVNFNRVPCLTFSSKAYEPGKLVKKFQTTFSDVRRFKRVFKIHYHQHDVGSYWMTLRKGEYTLI